MTSPTPLSLPLHIDSTMLTCFRSCGQKYLLEFVHGLRPPGISIDLHAGACFASALEETYKQVHMNNKSLGEAVLLAQAKFMTEWGNVEVPEWKRTAKSMDRVWEAVYNPQGDAKNKGYFDLYTPLTDHVQPYFDSNGKPTFEYTFAIPLEPCSDTYDPHVFPAHPSGSPFLYSGRFDMLGTYNGRPVVRDEKTTGGSIGQDWAHKWPLRNQFIGYTWACRQCGIDLDTVVVRGIAIQKTQIVHAEATPVYSDFIRDRWLEQLRRDLWRLRRSWDEGYFDFNLADTCTSYGNCQFINVCQSPNIASWMADFIVFHWNPLEKNPVKGVENVLFGQPTP